MLLTLVTLLPALTGMTGLIYLVVTLGLDGVFLYYAFAMRQERRVELPMRTFRYSITYLCILFAALLVDHYLRVAL